MGQAYTPGLKISKYTIIEKSRLLPLKGNVLVKKGDTVKSHDIIASADLPGAVFIEKLAQKLGILGSELPNYLKVKVGDHINIGDILVEKKGFLGIGKDTVKSPIDGFIESISEVTGQAVLRSEPTPVELSAYIGGEITEVFPEEGVIIETKGSMIQGIFGIGGERMGILKVMVNDNKESLPISELTEELKDLIIVVGSHIDHAFVSKAIKVGVKGIITAGMDDKDLRSLLGYEIGVAITGNEQIPLSIIVTEGFGKIDMAKSTFELLKDLDGKFASINGATQIRAGVIRPEVIVTDINALEGEIKESEYFLSMGKNIRIIRTPYFGKIAKVVGLPSELRELETEAFVRVVELELENGEKVIVPRANVEIIEQ